MLIRIVIYVLKNTDDILIEKFLDGRKNWGIFDEYHFFFFSFRDL